MVNFRQDWQREFDYMQKEMERFLEHFASCKRPLAAFSPGAWQPLVDVYETAEELVVLIDLGGVSCPEMELALSGMTLTMTAEREDHWRGRRLACHLMEITFGPFERSVDLPVAVDADRVKTSCQDGFLEIVFPKATEMCPQMLVVKTI